MNFPRLNVQNPQFTNVYEMERNAQANRPFAQLLNTGAKVIPAYIDQQKKEAEAQQLKDATNERNAFIENYGSGYLSGLTSPANFLPKLQSISPTDAKAMVDFKASMTPKPAAAQNLTDDKRAVYNSALQQLSSLRAAGVQPDDETYQRYEKLADAQEAELIKAGIIPASVREERMASKMEQTVAPVAGVEAPEKRIESASNEALAIVNSAEDKNNDGVIDDLVGLRAALDKLSSKYKINVKSPEWTAISGLLDTQEKAIRERANTAYSRQQDAESRGQQKEQSRLAQDAKYKPMWESAQRLNTNPSDPTNKRATMNLALRTETGAVIGADEFDGLMSTVLPSSEYAKLKADTQGLGITLLGMANDNVKDAYLKKIAENYLGTVDSKKLYQYVNDKIPDDYYKRKQSDPAAKKTAEAPKEESKLERIRRLREGKKQ